MAAVISSAAWAQPVVPRNLPTDFVFHLDSVSSAGRFDDPATVDYWVITAPAGQRLELEVNRREVDFDPFVWVFSGTIGNQSHFLGGETESIDVRDTGYVASANNGVGPLGYFQTQDPRLAVDLPGTSTTYTVIVGSFLSGSQATGTFDRNDGGDGQYSYEIRARLSPILAPAIVARRLFYNSSTFDGNNLSPGAADDTAIATDKAPYVAASGPAGFSNYSSYSRGLNGIMIDFMRLPGAPSRNDFEFRVGNSSIPANWTAPADFHVSAVTLRRGAGLNGSDRVTIIFADNAIRNQWLQVRVLATPATGLTTPDVHYWGHQAGETGNEAGFTRVNTSDTARIGANFSGFASVPTSNPFDLNRDGRVNTQDYSYSQTTYTGFNSLVLLNLP
jgi:hypothetical protein